MRYCNFLDVPRTSQQNYFKDGVDLLYPDQNHTLRIAILPAYDAKDPNPIGWVPSVCNGNESDFYTTIRAAKFVGHGNRRAKTSFLSPKTFNLDADDPYEAFYDYCSRSDKWSYLTKSCRGKRLTGEIEGAIIPRMKNFFVANVIDVSAGSRSGVFVTELPETIAKGLLYSMRKDGSRLNGLIFQKDDSGENVFADITNPDSALVLDVAWGGKGYVVRPALDDKGVAMRIAIPSTLLQHRKHMEEPASFVHKPENAQEIVSRLASMLRGYKSITGEDEINALEEAMEATYGKGKYDVEAPSQTKDDPFSDSAESIIVSTPKEKKQYVDLAITRGVEKETYTQMKKPTETKNRDQPKEPDVTPGEDIDPSDIAAMRNMLLGR